MEGVGIKIHIKMPRLRRRCQTEQLSTDLGNLRHAQVQRAANIHWDISESLFVSKLHNLAPPLI
jgi:hypothetical protein